MFGVASVTHQPVSLNDGGRDSMDRLYCPTAGDDYIKLI